MWYFEGLISQRKIQNVVEMFHPFDHTQRQSVPIFIFVDIFQTVFVTRVTLVSSWMSTI